MSEQEAVAGLYSLGQASPGYLDVQENLPSLGVTGIIPEDGSFTLEASRLLSEELQSNRPVLDEAKNYGIHIVTPHSNDVLSGRGNGVNHHAGNIYFRSLIQKYKPFYIHSGPSEKKLISKRIVQEVQNRDPPGRFLKQSDVTELWNSLELEKVLKKTGQALREKAPELKKKAKEDLIKSRAISSTASYFQKSNLDFSSPTNQDFFTFSSPNSVNAPFHKSMQRGRLDAFAYPVIPLTNTTDNGSFNLSHIASATNQVIVLDPECTNKAQEFVHLVTSSNGDNTLTRTFDFLKQNPIVVYNSASMMIKKVAVPTTTDSSVCATQSTNHGLNSSYQQQPSFHSIPNTNTVTPHDHDVLFNKDQIISAHPGSQFFLNKVSTLLPSYNGKIIHEKRLEQQIIASIGARWPPGRFLCSMDMTCTNWDVLSFGQALNATTLQLKSGLNNVIVPRLEDVLFTKGGENSQHAGNMHLHKLVEKLVPVASSSHLSYDSAQNIIREVQTTGGRFLKFNAKTNDWKPLHSASTVKMVEQIIRNHSKKVRLTSVTAAKPQKPVSGVVVPSLKYVKEEVNTTSSKSSDPPGIFYNYYSNECNDETESSLFVTMTGNDPPGQFANVVSSAHCNIECLDCDGDIIMIVDDLSATNQKRKTNQDKSSDIITPAEKRVKLEP